VWNAKGDWISPEPRLFAARRRAIVGRLGPTGFEDPSVEPTLLMTLVECDDAWFARVSAK
jgi:hypothetical protein